MGKWQRSGMDFGSVGTTGKKGSRARGVLLWLTTALSCSPWPLAYQVVQPLETSCFVTGRQCQILCVRHDRWHSRPMMYLAGDVGTRHDIISDVGSAGGATKN